MSRDRCPACGGLVAADAAWCGQCLTPLRGESARSGESPAGDAPPAAVPQTPAAPTPRAPGSPTEDAASREENGPAPMRSRSAVAAGPAGQHFREVDGELHWVCPACDAENPMGASACARCTTPFGSLLREPEERPSIDPGRATSLSLLYPGIGHIAAGRAGEGAARMVIFTWALASLVLVVVARAGKGLGPLLSLVVIYFGVSGLLYLLTAVDARRAAVGEDPVISSRVLLWGASLVMLLTVVILVFTGLGATR